MSTLTENDRNQEKLADLKSAVDELAVYRAKPEALRAERRALFARREELRGMDGVRDEWMATNKRLKELNLELDRVPSHISALEFEVWQRANALDQLLVGITIEELAVAVRAAVQEAKTLVPNEPPKSKGVSHVGFEGLHPALRNR